MKNQRFFEDNRWRHKGLEYLDKTPENKLEQQLLDSYLQGIEKKYNAKFVLKDEKNMLENEVRKALKNKIEEHTKNWEGEAYGNVKK